eukprot:6204694-Pleurochrysis_carterae.AAC.1
MRGRAMRRPLGRRAPGSSIAPLSMSAPSWTMQPSPICREQKRGSRGAAGGRLRGLVDISTQQKGQLSLSEHNIKSKG